MTAGPGITRRLFARLWCSGIRLVRFFKHLYLAVRALIGSLLILVPFVGDPDNCPDEDGCEEPPEASVTPCFIRVLVVKMVGGAEVAQENIAVTFGIETQAGTMSWISSPSYVTQTATPPDQPNGCVSRCVDAGYWHVYLPSYTAPSLAKAWVFEPKDDTPSGTDVTATSWDTYNITGLGHKTMRVHTTKTSRIVFIKFVIS